MPTSLLPEMTFRSKLSETPSALVPMRLPTAVEVMMKMPVLLGIAAVPAGFVPIKFPAMISPDPFPVMTMPLAMFPEITLPSAASLTPSPSVPMKLPPTDVSKATPFWPPSPTVPAAFSPM